MADPGDAGEIISLSWSRNALVPPWRNWRRSKPQYSTVRCEAFRLKLVHATGQTDWQKKIKLLEWFSKSPYVNQTELKGLCIQ